MLFWDLEVAEGACRSALGAGVGAAIRTGDRHFGNRVRVATTCMKLSVVVPTLRRSDTLRHTLASIRAQDYGDLEIVVQNNGNDPDTAAVVRELDDGRIKLFQTDHVLPMTENWERALANASGDYLTFIGDDDALLTNACSTAVETLAREKVDLLSWGPFAYYWPTYNHRDDLRNRIVAQTALQRSAQWLDSESILIGFYKFKFNYARLPMIYNSFVSRAIIDRIKLKNGFYFIGLSPDVTSGILNAANSTKYIRLTFPLSISGISHHSTGHKIVMSRRGTHSPDDMRRDFGDYKIDDRVPSLNHLQLALANDMLFLKDTLLNDRAEIQFDFGGLVRKVIATINDRPELYEENLATARLIATREGIDLSDVEIPRPGVQEKMEIGVKSVGSNRIQFVIDGNTIGLRHIGDAVNLAMQLLPKGGLSIDVPEAKRAQGAPDASFPSPRLAAGEPLFFAANQTGVSALQSGWGRPEAWGTWSVGDRAELAIRVPAELTGGIGLRLHHRNPGSPGNPPVAITCRVADHVIDRWECGDAVRAVTRDLLVPSNIVGADGELRLHFEIRNARSPAELGAGSDKRRLGIGIEWIKCVPKKPA